MTAGETARRISMSNKEQSGIMGLLFPSTLIEKIYRDMVIGNALFIIGASLLVYWDWLSSIEFGPLYTILGCVIISAPMQLKIWLLGGSPLKFWADYEVVTTYSDGSKTSDGGLQSNMFKIGYAVVMIFVGVAIQAIKLVFLPIRYIACYTKEDPKPSFIKSGFPVMLASLALLIIFPPNVSPYAARVANDKYYEKNYNAKLKKPSPLPVKEIRATLEEQQKKYLASHFDYYVEFGNVSHNGTDNITIIDITKKKQPKKYPAGTYHFINGNFDRFEDTYKTGSKPNAAQIEAVKAFTPHGLFGLFLGANDGDLWSRNITGYPSGHSEVLLKNLSWKNAIMLNYYDNFAGKWIRFEDNNVPNTFTWKGGVRGGSYDMKPRTVSSASEFPFLASVTEEFKLFSHRGYDTGNYMQPGTEMTVLGEGSGYFRVELHNVVYRVYAQDKLKNIGPAPKGKPAEFARETPFDAVVAEDIAYSIAGGMGYISAGTIVTVNNASAETARVINNWDTVEIFWKYLKPEGYVIDTTSIESTDDVEDNVDEEEEDDDEEEEF